MTSYKSKSIRTFIGAKKFQESRSFYLDLGFDELVIDKSMSFFKIGEDIGFYLQDYFVRDWVDNSMIFLEVDDLDKCQQELLAKNLPSKYDKVRFSEIKEMNWGRELFMHDPSGVLWHFGEFKS